MSKKVLDKDGDFCYNVPASVPICGLEVPVEIRPDLENDGEYHGEDMEKADSGRILMDAAVHPRRQRRVLLHETIHGIFRSTGLVELLGPQLEEAVCLALDHHLPAAIDRIWEEEGGERKRPNPGSTKGRATHKGTRKRK